MENLIKNAKEILKTRSNIIKAYKKSKGESTNLIDFDDGNDDDANNDDDNGNDDDDDDANNDDDDDDGRKLPNWVNVSRKRFNEIKKSS